MKLQDLNQHTKDTLYFEARDLLDDKRRPLTIPLDWRQLHSLRSRLGIVIGPEQEVLRIESDDLENGGFILRECCYGIACPSHWYCGGKHDKKCTTRSGFSCGIPTGYCMELNANWMPEIEKERCLRTCEKCRVKHECGKQSGMEERESGLAEQS